MTRAGGCPDATFALAWHASGDYRLRFATGAGIGPCSIVRCLLWHPNSRSSNVWCGDCRSARFFHGAAPVAKPPVERGATTSPASDAGPDGKTDSDWGAVLHSHPDLPAALRAAFDYIRG